MASLFPVYVHVHAFEEAIEFIHRLCNKENPNLLKGDIQPIS